MALPASRFLVLVLAVALAVPASARAESPLLYPPERIAIDGWATNAVSVLDFDADGIPDIALLGTRKVQLILGTETGWQQVQTATFATDPNPTQMAVGDVTGDGMDDIAVVIAITGEVVVFRGSEDGVLTEPAAADRYAVGPPDGSYIPGPGVTIDIGDVNGDGSLDIVAGFRPAASFQIGKIVVLANNGDGTFTAQPAIDLSGIEQVRLVRLGGDADPDLLVAQGYGGGIVEPGTVNGKLAVMPGATGAGFEAAETVLIPNGAVASVDAGDFNDDGAADLAVGRRSSTYGGAGPEVLLGNPDTSDVGSPLGIGATAVDGFGSRVVVGDVDRDGLSDVTYDVGSYGFDLARSLGDGTFGAFEVGAYMYPAYMMGWTLGDADDDGKLDALTIGNDLYGPSPEVQIYYGSGPRLRPHDWYADFGEVVVGSASPAASTTFGNDGPGTAGRLELWVAGDHSQFELTQDACSGRTLAVGQRCAIGARFRPTIAGDAEMQATVVAPDSDEAWAVSLFGTGTEPPAPAPALAPAAAPPPAVSAPVQRPPSFLRRVHAPRFTGHGRGLQLDTGAIAHCPANGPQCTVKLVVLQRVAPGHRATVIARQSFRLTAGSERAITSRLTAAGRRLVRKHGTRATLQMKVSRTSMPVATASLNLKLPRAKR